LVTAFEPYDGSLVNPSKLVIEQLPDSIRGVFIRKVILPCDSQKTPLRAVSFAHDPSVTITVMLGEDQRYSLPTIEQIAYNWLDYEVSDNLGKQPRCSPIILHGPSLLALPLDAKAVQLALLSKGIEVDISDNPGRHLCNHTYYLVRYHTNPKITVLFHLPRIPEQRTYPNLPLDESLRATQGLLEYLAIRLDNVCG
jgi:pyrrolidone-carboxylate peptidase